MRTVNLHDVPSDRTAWKRSRSLPLLLAAWLLSGCAEMPRLPAPPTAFSMQTPAGFPADIRQIGIDGDRTVETVNRWLTQVSTGSGDGRLHVLALSGGGAGSAFGAGALAGMSRTGTRPQFQVVTGISAGALLAPFAFLGPEWDGEMIAAFDGGAATGLLHKRGLAALFHPGVYDGEPLRRLVDRFVTDRMLEAIAVESAKGRRLLVATTDLDSQESVIWDMGRIAARGGEAARTLFREVLVASASIPGIFPPVLIRVGSGDQSFDEMHVDGGTTTPFFVTPEAGLFLLQKNEVMKDAQVYVLVNGQIGAPVSTTRTRPIPIVSRGFSSALMHSTRKSLELVEGLSQRLDFEFRFSAIPATYPYKGALDFDHDTMHALFQYGQRCAEAGRFWMSVDDAMLRARQLAETSTQSAEECPAGPEPGPGG